MNTRSNTTRTQAVFGTSIQRIVTSGLIGLVALAMVAHQLWLATGMALAAAPEVSTLQDLVASGQGDVALAQVAAEALARGNWQPAPGDMVAYDPRMNRDLRGGVIDFDEIDCSGSILLEDECLAQFHALEQLVRFGPSLFTTPVNGETVLRPAFDDLLSTFIEESGHSWQEYLYETNGRGTGARTRETSLAESERWWHGREYQIKRYILNLDGDLLALSDQQRGNLRTQICEGYANPIGYDVPAWGAPAGWPRPEGWPTAAPSADELAAFCASA
jgi:hypothetical protein